MTVSTWSAELQRRDTTTWPAYLTECSGLPGPRANLALVTAVAALATSSTSEALAASGDEYHAMCAAAALGRRADDDDAAAARARALAQDERWRVREGVVLGLQLLGDASPASLAALVAAWVADPDPLVQRAAVAAICEPRLLRTPDASTLAIDTCLHATENLTALSADERRSADARVLRQALGYCWSVAVAASPALGLPVFRELDVSDPDVAWIVDQNRRKKRLSALLSA